MKVYISNISRSKIGGGFTFIRNFKKAIGPHAQLVNDWQSADIVLIAGVTVADKGEIRAASAAGKKIVLRVDNVPRKSRSKRSTPHERLAEFARLSDLVIYQSEWAADYCRPLCGDGMVIYNGVDRSIFNTENRPAKNCERFLYAYYGKDEHKAFWEAHFYFQMYFRENIDREFWFIYDFGRETGELAAANFDFWQGEKHRHLPRIDDPEQMAHILKQCDYLIYPAICDAAPNMILEARACGVKAINYRKNELLGGTREMVELEDIGLERMGREYISAFRILMGPEGQI